MKWEKQGLIFCPKDEFGWRRQFAMLPTPYLVEPDRLRIFLGFCDEKMRGRIGYVDVDPRNPSTVLSVSEEPLTGLGRAGTFDDNGLVPISLVEKDGIIYLYYVGFQLGVQVPYYMFTGLLISEDRGVSFHRFSETPVLDRCTEELYARCGTFIVHDPVHHILQVGLKS